MKDFCIANFIVTNEWTNVFHSLLSSLTSANRYSAQSCVMTICHKWISHHESLCCVIAFYDILTSFQGAECFVTGALNGGNVMYEEASLKSTNFMTDILFDVFMHFGKILEL